MISGQNLAIGIALTMKDNFTRQAIQASNMMGQLTGQARNLAAAEASLARNSNMVAATIGGGMVASMVRFHTEAADFNYTLKYVSLLADETGKSFDKLKNKAIEVGKQSSFSPTEVIDGMRWMAQAGMKADSIINSISASARLAQATMSSLGGRGGAADWVTNIALGFGLKLTTDNIERLTNVLAKGANKANTTLHELGEAMKYTQNSAHTMGMGLEETVASIMTLGNLGIQASMAGTATENMLRYVSRAAGSSPGSKQHNALAKLGLSPKDLLTQKGELKQIGDLMSLFVGQINGLTANEKYNAIVDIFGVRGQRGTSIKEQLETYDDFLKQLKANDNYVSKVAGGMMDTDKGAIMIMMDNWKAFKIEFGTSIAPLITPIIKGLTSLVSIITTFTSTTFGSFIAKGVLMFTALKTAQFGYRAMLLSINLLTGKMGGTMSTTGSVVSGNFHRMNTAASIYQQTLQRIAMLTGAVSSGPGRIGQYRHGGHYQVGPGGGYIPLNNNSYKVGMHKLSNFFNKASIPMMLAGTGLSLASDSLGGNSNSAGMGVGVLGDTLGFAGTGAAIGSMIPGIGTAIGGIVGGITGLLYSISSRLEDANKKLESTKQDSETKLNNRLEKVKKEYDLYSKMNFLDRAWVDTRHNLVGSIMKGGSGKLPEHYEREISNNIIIKFEGNDIFKKNVSGDFEELINLGII